MTRIITVTSARGGVGTSSIALNLAVQLAGLGQRVCLLDAEPNAPTVAARLGLQPGHSLRDLVLEGLPLDRVLIRNCQGIDVVPGAACPDCMSQSACQQHLVAALRQLDGYDWVLIDSVAGVEASGLNFALASPELIVTVTPQREHLAEAYALLKLLAMRGYRGTLWVVVNRSAEDDVAERTCDRLSEPVRRHLDLPLSLLGGVREDSVVQRGLVPEPSLVRYAPDSPAARDLAALARRLLASGSSSPQADVGAFADAWLQRTEGREAFDVEFATGAPSEERGKREDVEQQVEALSVQVEQLVAEMNRLREEGEDIARLVASPEPQGRPAAARHSAPDVEAWIADRASGSEQVRVEELSFPVYELLRPNHTTLRVACHQVEAEGEEAAPQSTSP